MDLFSRYIAYTSATEPPVIYHRWCAISLVGAVLSRNYFVQHGMFRVFPNLYTLIIGEAGTRKSTAVKIAKKLVTSAGYDNIGADKTSKEKFLLDLEGVTDEELLADRQVGRKAGADNKTYENLFGDMNEDVSFREPREVYVMADEFNEFAGTGNLEFYTTLGNLWDWDDENSTFKQRLKNSRSVSIYQPTVSILGGNTPENFARAFPPEIIGQGFLSRMILIYGEPSGRKFTFPVVPKKEDTDALVKEIVDIRAKAKGAASFDEEALLILDKIYREWQPIDDVRFKSYSNRRFTQLLKLCLICSAARGARCITKDTVIEANTYLSAVEATMPKALGEFGKSRNAEVTNKIMDILSTARKALTTKDLWAYVYKDLTKMTELGDIMQNLCVAGKAQHITNKGFLILPDKKRAVEFVDYERYLTEEERKML